MGRKYARHTPPGGSGLALLVHWVNLDKLVALCPTSAIRAPIENCSVCENAEQDHRQKKAEQRAVAQHRDRVRRLKAHMTHIGLV